jgi:hypothetical protein
MLTARMDGFLIQSGVRLVFQRLNSGLYRGNGQSHAPDDLPRWTPPPLPIIGGWVGCTACLDVSKRNCLAPARNRIRIVQH